MFYRFTLFLTVLTFSYVASFDALAKHVRKKRRTLRTNLNVASHNNKYRTIFQEKKIRTSMKKYWKGRKIEDLFQDAQDDYERILKKAKYENPGSRPEEEMQRIVDTYMASNRSTKVSGVKDIEKEAKLYLPPKAIYYMKKSNISIKSAAKNLKGEINVRAYADMLYSIEDEMGKSNSRQAKKYRALLKRFMNLQTTTANFALDLSGVGLKLGTTKRLVARGTASARDRAVRTVDGRGAGPANGMRGRVERNDIGGRDAPVRRDANMPVPNLDVINDPGVGGLDEQDPFMDEMKNRALAEDEAFKKRMESKKEGIEDLAKKAKEKAKQGMMLVALGIALIIAGIVMMLNPATKTMGMMLMMAGAAMLMMGMQKLGEAKEMGEEAKKQKKAAEEEVEEYTKKRKEEYRKLEEEQKKKIYRQKMLEMEQKKQMEIRRRQQDAAQQVR